MIVSKCGDCNSVPEFLSGPNEVCNCVANPEFLHEGFVKLDRMLSLDASFKEYLANRADAG